MSRLADAYCNFGEAMTVFSDDRSMDELRKSATTARYAGTDAATGEQIEVGDKIARLGTGWTHVVEETE